MTLYATETKESQGTPVAHVTMLSVSSQPVDHDERRHPPTTDLGLTDILLAF